MIVDVDTLQHTGTCVDGGFCRTAMPNGGKKGRVEGNSGCGCDRQNVVVEQR